MAGKDPVGTQRFLLSQQIVSFRVPQAQGKHKDKILYEQNYGTGQTSPKIHC